MLDCLPDVLAVGRAITKSDGKIYLGINPDQSIYEAIKLVNENIAKQCISSKSTLFQQKIDHGSHLK